MATTLDLSTHRPWEDWCCMALGLVTVVSPAIAPMGDAPTWVTLNIILVGTFAMLVGYLELDSADRWEQWAEMALGAWLIASPWAFGYAGFGLATALHVGCGAGLVALGLLELCQDRSRTA